MGFKRFLIFLLVGAAFNQANAQSKNGSTKFQKQDIALLDILFKDSTHSLKLQLS